MPGLANGLKRFSFYLFIITVIGAVGFIYVYSAPAPVYCSKSFSKNEQDIIMFSTRWCPYCKKARKVFTKHHVKYCEYDVNSSPQIQDLFTKLGGSGVPLILIGEETFYGFSKEGLTSALLRNGLIKQDKQTVTK